MLLPESLLKKTIDVALSTGASFADIFIEDTYSSSLKYINQKPDQAINGRVYGAGIRLFFGEEIIYVTTNDLTESGLIKAATTAARSRGDASQLLIQAAQLKTVPQITDVHPLGLKPWEIDREKKFKWLRALDQSARAQSSFVTQVEANLLERNQRVQIANSKGLMVFDERAYSRIGYDVTVEKNGEKESSGERDGRLGSSEYFDALDFQSLAKESVRRALVLTEAAHAPAGEMPVLIANGFGGVLFHEACGHGLETTSIAKKASVFCDKLGERIAPECVTAFDDGTLTNLWGSENRDDEGNLTQKTVLIEKGILKSYMVDQMGSIQTGYPITGSGRRESYHYAPASRMRNTAIAAGTDRFESMIKDVDYGLYAESMGGGSVNPGTGDYNFKVREAFMIRNGKLAEPVKGACLIGRGIDTLSRIVKVSDEFKWSIGMCGSVSGSIPTSCGQPHVLVSKLTVGGRAS
jgi:TldD protein